MQSVIHKKSYGSVKVFWLDKALLKKRLKKAAKRLMCENFNVEKVVLFGSLAEDRATAFSDADIMILVKKSKKRFMDRPLDFTEYFQDIGIQVDIFVYTSEEAEQGSNFIHTIQHKGECVTER